MLTLYLIQGQPQSGQLAILLDQGYPPGILVRLLYSHRAAYPPSILVSFLYRPGLSTRYTGQLVIQTRVIRYISQLVMQTRVIHQVYWLACYIDQGIRQVYWLACYIDQGYPPGILVSLLCRPGLSTKYTGQLVIQIRVILQVYWLACYIDQAYPPGILVSLLCRPGLSTRYSGYLVIQTRIIHQ